MREACSVTDKSRDKGYVMDNPVRAGSYASFKGHLQSSVTVKLAVKPQNGRQSMAMKVWRKGEELVHDACFDANEDRSAYTPVDLNTLDEDDMCEVCSGEFLSGPDVDEDDDDDDDDDEKPEAS
jgi:hypothetical protein